MRHDRLILFGCRQALRLLIIEILETVLQVAQEHVGRLQIVGRFRRKHALLRQQPQGGLRRAQAQRRVLATSHQLENLSDELDLANPAGSQLDVVVQLAARHLGADLCMQPAQRCDGTVIEVTAIDERRYDGVEVRLRCAAHHPRLYPRVAFPLAPLGMQVLLEHVVAHGKRAAVTIGPQPHVHPEHLALRSVLGHRADQPTRKASEVFLVGDGPRAAGLAVFGIEKHEIDVGRDVELLSPELAHTNHHQVLPFAAALSPGDAVGCLHPWL